MAGQEPLSTSDVATLVTFCEMAADTIKFNLLIAAFASHRSPEEFAIEYKANKANYVNNFREVHNLFTVLNAANASGYKVEAMESMLNRIKNFKYADLKDFTDKIKDNYLIAKEAFEELKRTQPEIGRLSIDVISEHEADQAVADIPFVEENAQPSTSERTVAGGTPVYRSQYDDRDEYLRRVRTNKEAYENRYAHLKREFENIGAAQQPAGASSPAQPTDTTSTTTKSSGAKPNLGDLIMKAMADA